MSLFHNSPAMERVAEKHHQSWAVVSLMSAAVAVIGAGLTAPFIRVPSLFGWIMKIQFFLQCALVAYGVSGAVFHLKGARDHTENRRELARRAAAYREET